MKTENTDYFRRDRDETKLNKVSQYFPELDAMFFETTDCRG